jgi:hypothetical protein
MLDFVFELSQNAFHVSSGRRGTAGNARKKEGGS